MKHVIDCIRQELIDSGQATQMLLAYIDDRVEKTVEKYLDDKLPQIEENLYEKLREELDK